MTGPTARQTTRLNIPISPPLARSVRLVADSKGVTVASYVRGVLRAEVDRFEDMPDPEFTS